MVSVAGVMVVKLVMVEGGNVMLTMVVSGGGVKVSCGSVAVSWGSVILIYVVPMEVSTSVS